MAKKRPIELSTERTARKNPPDFNIIGADIHRSREIAELKELLLELFVRAGLVGTFTLRSVSQIAATAHTKGLKIGSHGETFIPFNWHPGGNDSRIQYNCSFPRDKVPEAYDRLINVLATIEAERKNRSAQPAPPEGGAGDEIETDAPEVDPRFEIVFDCNLTPEETNLVRVAIEESLGKYGTEFAGAHYVRGGIPQEIYHGFQGIKFKAHEAGQSALPFCFGFADPERTLRFSLTPVDDIEIEDLEGVLVEKAPPPPAPAPEKAPARGFVQTLIDDQQRLVEFMTRFAELVKEKPGGVFSPDVVTLFKEVYGEDYSGQQIGRFNLRLVNDSILRSTQSSFAKNVKQYTLGMKAVSLLPEELQGMAPRSLTSFEKPPAATPQPVKPAPEPELPSAAELRSTGGSVLERMKADMAKAEAAEKLLQEGAARQEEIRKKAAALHEQLAALDRESKAIDTDLTEARQTMAAFSAKYGAE